MVAGVHHAHQDATLQTVAVDVVLHTAVIDIVNRNMN